MAGNLFHRLIVIVVLALAGILFGMFFPAPILLYPIVGMFVLAIALHFVPKGVPELFISYVLIFVSTFLMGTIFSGAL